jgi:hypothetical protein
MIEIKITIPHEDIGDADALKKRMALLGYTPPGTFVWKQVEGPDVYAEAAKTVYKPSSEARAAETAVTNTPRVGETEQQTEARRKTRAKKAEPAPNITAAPEARVDPEVEAQDEADEAAEVAASGPASPQPTAEDLRAEMGAYAAKFGMPATLEDGTAIFTGALGPAPEGGWKLSVVAGIGGETLAKAVVSWRAAAAGSARYVEGA